MSDPPGEPARSILVVDDDEQTRNLLRDVCETSGFSVRMAEDGAVALERISEKLPDLLLLDLMMPRRDGFSVLEKIRRTPRWAELPVILLTAMGDINGKVRGMELGADDYVTKPFRLLELQTRINSALKVRQFRNKLASEEEVSALGALDPVTGAGSYSQLKASLDAELARSRRYGRPLAALLVGVDDYQTLRYQLGRDGCDELISKVAGEVRSVLRGADRLFRLDADELVVLMPETDLSGARLAGTRLLEKVSGISAQGRSGKLSVVARVGGAVFPHERVNTGEDLLRETYRIYRLLREQGAAQLFEA